MFHEVDLQGQYFEPCEKHSDLYDIMNMNYKNAKKKEFDLTMTELMENMIYSVDYTA